jgi:hypothetical protein
MDYYRGKDLDRQVQMLKGAALVLSSNNAAQLTGSIAASALPKVK